MYAARDFAGAVVFIRNASQHQRFSAAHLGSSLGALISYGRPFTERANAALNQRPEHRSCFLELALDLGVSMEVHTTILQLRDAVVARSDVQGAPTTRLAGGSRCQLRYFSYPDPECTRIVRRLNPLSFERIANLMRLACVFFLAEVDCRGM
jgi:hypothetical protein